MLMKSTVGEQSALSRRAAWQHGRLRRTVLLKPWLILRHAQNIQDDEDDGRLCGGLEHLHAQGVSVGSRRQRAGKPTHLLPLAGVVQAVADAPRLGELRLRVAPKLLVDEHAVCLLRGGVRTQGAEGHARGGARTKITHENAAHTT